MWTNIVIIIRPLTKIEEKRTIFVDIGAISLVEEVEAAVVWLVILIEKSFQPGRIMLDEKCYDVYWLERISKLQKDIIEFI